MNLLLSRMDEQQRRWYGALESLRVGRGGDVRLGQITGLSVETLRRGCEELDNELQDRPADRLRRERSDFGELCRVVERIRLPGGGRPPVEKKTPPSKRT